MDKSIDLDDWLDELDAAIAGVGEGDTYTITRAGRPVASFGPRHGIEP